MRLSILSQMKAVSIIGCANGQAGRLLGCEQAVDVLKKSIFLKNISYPIHWKSTIEEVVSGRHADALQGVLKTCHNLAVATRNSIESGEETIVLGGDHSCAIGTWSGVSSAMRKHGDIGLIWVDAHMDAHTPDSSPSGNIHGQPVAHLLGSGNEGLLSLEGFHPKIKPENMCLVGIRSYETPEEMLLRKLGVRVFYMDEVKRRGIADVMQEAHQIVNKKTVGFGLSIDIDGFDTTFAPAVGTPAEDGINAKEFMEAMLGLDLRKLVATEIVEFLPERDDQLKTSEQLVSTLMEIIYATKFFQKECLLKIRGGRG